MPSMTLNSRGAEVAELTAILVARNYLTVAGNLFDRRVLAAVKEFQARHVDSRGRPLVTDGKVGPLTWWALRNPDNTDVLSRPVDAALFEMAPGGSPAGRAALEAAIAEMRAGAREEGANNSGPWVEKYLNGLAGIPNNWCGGFVSWCYGHAPEGMPFRYSLGARDIRNQFQRKGWAFDAGDRIPEPGDIVAWWRGQLQGWQGHIGLVHHVDDGILYTIEGNKGGFPAPVRVFDYVLSRMDRLLGFGRVSG